MLVIKGYFFIHPVCATYRKTGGFLSSHLQCFCDICIFHVPSSNSLTLTNLSYITPLLTQPVMDCCFNATSTTNTSNFCCLHTIMLYYCSLYCPLPQMPSMPTSLAPKMLPSTIAVAIIIDDDFCHWRLFCLHPLGPMIFWWQCNCFCLSPLSPPPHCFLVLFSKFQK